MSHDDHALRRRQIFVEINPFHAITLGYYHTNLSENCTDAILSNKRLFGQELFDEIHAPKTELSLWRFIALLWKNRIERCHFNTINLTLTPITWETTKLNLLTVLLPLVARAFGCKNAAIVHEADQFFATGIDSCRRNTWFRNLIGRWYIRLFHDKYVLSREVADFLQSHGVAVQLLDPKPLATFASETRSVAAMLPTADRRIICWIGPVVSFRRSWRPLLELDAERLERLRVSVAMVCDSRVGEGPELKSALEHAGLSKYFTFLDYRPDDCEVFSWVRRSAGVLCLYSGREYSTTKTSGARIIATAFQKPFIANYPALGVYQPDGRRLSDCTNLMDCIERIVNDELQRDEVAANCAES